MMDEATSSVDNSTDHLIQKIFKEKFVDSTMIVIADRLMTVLDSDLICIVDNGRCAELGTHKEHMKIENSLYRNLFQKSRI